MADEPQELHHMPLKINSLMASDKLASEGVWVDMDGGPSEPEGWRVKVRWSNCPEYRHGLAELIKPHKRKLTKNNDLPVKLMEKISTEAVARYVVIDWEGIQDDDGKDIPYDHKLCMQYMLKSPEFAEMINGAAGNLSLFQDEEEDSGN